MFGKWSGAWGRNVMRNCDVTRNNIRYLSWNVAKRKKVAKLGNSETFQEIGS